jgi:hypothetical protein
MRSIGKGLTSVKTWDDFSSEDEPPRSHDKRSSSCSSRLSHKCLMARDKSSIPSSSDDRDDCNGGGKASLEELAQAINFFADVCTKQKVNLKL